MRSACTLHPVTLLVYLVSVLLITMFAAVPSMSVIALLFGMVWSAILLPSRHPLREYSGMALLFVIVMLTNPLFSHNGVTVLFFLNNNPVTLEAVLYGAHLGAMLLGMLVWFRAFGAMLTEDKLLYMFGGISPRLALLLSMTLRLIPLLKSQAATLRIAQTTLGGFASDTWTDKCRATLRVYSALITHSLEHAIATGASMKARGYGLKGRRHFSRYTFRVRDAVWLVVILILDAAVIAALVAGKLTFSFYPSIVSAPFDAVHITSIAAFALLCAMPICAEIKEVLTWKYSLSKV